MRANAGPSQNFVLTSYRNGRCIGQNCQDELTSKSVNGNRKILIWQGTNNIRSLLFRNHFNHKGVGSKSGEG